MTLFDDSYPCSEEPIFEITSVSEEYIKDMSYEVAVVIPALNESQTIERIVQSVRTLATPIVVDDGSTDNTGTLARNAGAIVLTHQYNRGYDDALENGIKKAQIDGYKYVVTLDADGQHDPAILRLFLAEFGRGADLIVGTRDRMQRWSEFLFCEIGRRMWRVKDPLCGLKGYRVSVLEKLNGNINNYNLIGAELVVRLSALKIKIVEIPIVTNKRVGESRFGDGFKVNIKILKALMRCIFLNFKLKQG